MRKKSTVREIQSKNLRDVEKVRIEKTAYETHRENWLYIDIRETRVKYSCEHKKKTKKAKHRLVIFFSLFL